MNFFIHKVLEMYSKYSCNSLQSACQTFTNRCREVLVWIALSIIYSTIKYKVIIKITIHLYYSYCWILTKTTSLVITAILDSLKHIVIIPNTIGNNYWNEDSHQVRYPRELIFILFSAGICNDARNLSNKYNSIYFDLSCWPKYA